MTKDVLVSVSGIQYFEKMDVEKIETTVPGCYYKKKDKHYVVFEENYQDGSEPVKTLAKFDDKRVMITKNGEITTNLDFEEGKQMRSSYVTRYGTIMLETDTKSLKVYETDSEIRIELLYTMAMDDKPYADCELSMIIKAKS